MVLRLCNQARHESNEDLGVFISRTRRHAIDGGSGAGASGRRAPDTGRCRDRVPEVAGKLGTEASSDLCIGGTSRRRVRGFLLPVRWQEKPPIAAQLTSVTVNRGQADFPRPIGIRTNRRVHIGIGRTGCSGGCGTSIAPQIDTRISQYVLRIGQVLREH